MLAELDIEGDGAPLMVPVVLRNATYRLALDTGAGTTALNAVHRQSLGRPTDIAEMDAEGGAVEMELFRVPIVRIGSMKVRRSTDICCADLQHFKDGDGNAIDGLLGMDVLRDFVIEIDFDNRKLRFRSAALKMGRAVPISWDDTPGLDLANRCPFVEGVLDGDDLREKFLIDTGAIVNISGSLADVRYDALLKKARLAPIPMTAHDYIITAYGNLPRKEGRASGLTIGGYHHSNFVFMREPAPSCLGLGYLSRYRVTFDFPHGLMYLVPGKGFDQQDVYDLSGVRLVKHGGVLMTDWVREGSIGAAAGVRAGDSIVAIDDQNTRELTLYAARRLLSVAGRHALQLVRGGVARRIVLDLSEAPPPRSTATREK